MTLCVCARRRSRSLRVGLGRRQGCLGGRTVRCPIIFNAPTRADSLPFFLLTTFPLARCWELSAGNIKWIYQVPILTAIGVSRAGFSFEPRDLLLTRRAESQSWRSALTVKPAMRKGSGKMFSSSRGLDLIDKRTATSLNCTLLSHYQATKEIRHVNLYTVCGKATEYCIASCFAVTPRKIFQRTLRPTYCRTFTFSSGCVFFSEVRGAGRNSRGRVTAAVIIGADFALIKHPKDVASQCVSISLSKKP